MPGRRIGKLPQYLALGAIIIASSAWCVTAASRLGATFDEPNYVRCGLAFWHDAGGNDFLLLHGAMPLPQDVDGLLLRLQEHFRGAPWNPTRDLVQMLPIARAGTLIFWWILLIYAWKLGKLIGGSEGGLLAAALIAVEPVMLGHASLVTNDMALAAFVVATTFYFVAGRNASWTRRVGAPALCCGLSILSKASGLAFVALCIIAVEVERLWPTDTSISFGAARWVEAWRLRLRPLWRELAQIMGLGLLIMVVYCGSGWHPQWSFVAWAKALPPRSILSAPMVWLSENLRVFNNGITGMLYQVTHNMHHQPAYLLGKVENSFWYYYPLALTIKLSIPIFIIAFTLAIIRPQALRNPAIFAAGALLAFSLTMRLQLGIRLVLPLVALLIIGLAGALANVWRQSRPGWKSNLLAAEIVLAILWTGAAAIHVWPQGICYTNALWGGTSRGYYYLSDSNYDWGQGVPDLLRWERSHGVTRMAVLYFGTDDRIIDPRLVRLMPPDFTTANLDALAAHQGLRYLAAGTTVAYGAYFQDERLRRFAPIDRTATFLIYDLSHFTSGSVHATSSTGRIDFSFVVEAGAYDLLLTLQPCHEK